MTTVLLLLLICLAFTRFRPFPAIMHPQPQLRVGCDAARDHLVDSSRQRHRFLLAVAQLIDVDRLLELQTVPEPVRYAKGEHNCRAEAESHPRGGIGGPGRDAKEG